MLTSKKFENFLFFYFYIFLHVHVTFMIYGHKFDKFDKLTMNKNDLFINIENRQMFRKLAIKLFGDVLPGKIKENIADYHFCFRKIAELTKPFHKEMLHKLLSIDNFPEQWAYEWARWIGNENLMIKRINSEYLAYWWAS